VAGSSPWEWEPFQRRATQADTFFIVVSAYDLNEQFLCDFHADVVPIGRSVGDLRESHSEWAFWKRILSRYPLSYVRQAFPTAGRSQGVMYGLRDELKNLLKPGPRVASGPVLGVGGNNADLEYRKERITDWSEARLLRRTTLMRAACEGKHWFTGPKHTALIRMERDAAARGRLVVLVLPVSSRYTKEFMTPEVTGQFEEALQTAAKAVPAAQWVRLDRSSSLQADKFYYDLVHLNADGREAATHEFLGCLAQTASTR
jgi:hypothetical protein